MPAAACFKLSLCINYNRVIALQTSGLSAIFPTGVIKIASTDSELKQLL